MIINEGKLFNLIRIPFYLWTAYECFLLAYLYHFGYSQIKKTGIIYWLTKLFFMMGIAYLYRSFLPVIRYFDLGIYDICLFLLIIPVAFVAFCLRKFRHWSLKKE